MSNQKFTALLMFAMAFVGSCAFSAEPEKTSPEKLQAFRDKVKHIVVIYQENWSFDGLYGKFPGANGIANASKESVAQTDRRGKKYDVLPQPMDTEWKPSIPDRRFPGDLPVQPFDLNKYIAVEGKSPDLIHRFHPEQFQIHGGKMDRFVAWSDAGGLVMSYCDATDLPEGKLAQEFTLCDNFFHGAFGGSFLNHIWLVAAATPMWPEAPKEIRIRKNEANYADGVVTEDDHCVNTVFSVNKPRPKGMNKKELLLPNLKLPTIGDRLTDKNNIDWAWFSGGWNRALAGEAETNAEFAKLFQFHHQPFVYFERYADGTDAKKQHLKDEQDFLAALKTDSFPAVSFIKPYGIDNEHPGYAELRRGQQHVAMLVESVRSSPYWKDTVIIITYDENGGRWDHVAPPKVDEWGPGTRVPTIVVSPFARKNHVDHTQYETSAILKLIENRFELEPLSDRDRNAGDLLNALSF